MILQPLLHHFIRSVLLQTRIPTVNPLGYTFAEKILTARKKQKIAGRNKKQLEVFVDISLKTEWTEITRNVYECNIGME